MNANETVEAVKFLAAQVESMRASCEEWRNVAETAQARIPLIMRELADAQKARDMYSAELARWKPHGENTVSPDVAAQALTDSSRRIEQLKAAQAAIEPRTDEQVRDAIASVEGDARDVPRCEDCKSDQVDERGNCFSCLVHANAAKPERSALALTRGQLENLGLFARAAWEQPVSERSAVGPMGDFIHQFAGCVMDVLAAAGKERG